MTDQPSNAPGPTAVGTRHGRRAAALAIAAAAAVSTAAVPGVAAAAPALPHTLGALPATGHVSATTGLQALRSDVSAMGADLYTAAALPAAVDLTGFAVAPGDQGPHGACVSFTIGHSIAGWHSNHDDHEGAPFDPMYLYNQVNGGSDTRGTSFYGNISVAQSQGVVEAASWTHPFSDYRSKPTTAERANAALHKLAGSTTLFLGTQAGTTAQVAIQTALAANQPVGIGIPVYSNFFWVNPSDSLFTQADATGSIRGYHAIAALGYNAQGLIIENSWGAGWGNGGFATLGWDFVNAQVDEAYAVGSFAANALPPVVAKVSVPNVSTRGGGSVTATVSRLASVDTTSASAVRFVSVADPSVSVNATVTGRTGTTVTVTVPTLPADGQYRLVVTGRGGASVPNAGADVVTALQPYSVALAAGQVARSDKATALIVNGTGFGATAAAFSANKITATVAGKTASVGRISDTQLKVTVPVAAAGTARSIVIYRKGVASDPVAFSTLRPLPVVSAPSPSRISDAGGTSVTVAVRNAPSVSEATTVTLVSTADPSATATATITARTASSLTFTAPVVAQGGYHVVVSNSGGESVKATADLIGVRTPFTGTTTATQASAGGGTQVSVRGSGFGATSSAYSANKITATVKGKTAPVKWVSDTAVLVTVPAGTLGTAAPIVLLHDKVAGAPVTGLTYAAAVSRVSSPAGARTGWTSSVSGVAFTGSGSWALVDTNGDPVVSLPKVATPADLKAASGGAVLVTSNTAATVRLPAGTPGSYRLTFVPNQVTYPGATVMRATSATVTYRA
jgi:hypothetical protein